MTKKFSIIIAILCVFVLAFTGCVKPPAEPAVPTISATDSAQDTRLASLEGQMATKMESASGTDIANRVTALEGQTAANAYTKDQTYTKAEIDELLRSKINEHIDISHTGTTGSTTTTTTTTGDYGELLDSDGDLQLWLEEVSGAASDELRTTQPSNNEARFDFVVVNLDTEDSHDFTIDFDFDPEMDVKLVEAGGVIDTTKTFVNTSGGLTYTVIRSPNSAKTPLYLNQSNKGRILKGDAEDFTVWLYIGQDTPIAGSVDWEWDITIDDKD